MGKTCLIKRLLFGSFDIGEDQTIEDIYALTLAVDCLPTKLQITELGGLDEFRPMIYPHIRESDGFIVVYAIDDNSSFEGVEPYIEDIMRIKGTRDVPFVLCGNKCDLEAERVVPKSAGEELAQRMGAAFYETSALADVNIDEAFHATVREIRKRSGVCSASTQ